MEMKSATFDPKTVVEYEIAAFAAAVSGAVDVAESDAVALFGAATAAAAAAVG